MILCDQAYKAISAVSQAVRKYFDRIVFDERVGYISVVLVVVVFGLGGSTWKWC
jgi:hypothetical protein